jgi:hypothetical protein
VVTLYRVDLTASIVVLANSPEQAERYALAALAHLDSGAFDAFAPGEIARAADVATLGHGWDLACFPYGPHDAQERTIGDWLAQDADPAGGEA